MTFDLIIIGGGIVGVATALELQRARPDLSLCLVEKEQALASHQTGRNSGVIHAGVYYQPGSLKARFCKEGVAATIQFCREHGIAFEQCGKLLVATGEAELARMTALQARAEENGLDLERLDAAELKRREPHISGLGALFSPTTGIVDYGEVTRKMAGLFELGGGVIRRGESVVAIVEQADQIVILTDRGELRARHMIACGGLMADRLARMCGIDIDFRIVPFRGEYFRLAPRHDQIVKHLIYPIPDPSLPFLGIHLTRMIGGYVTVGPNAVLAFAREGYRLTDISPRDLMEMAAFPGFWRLIGQHMGPALAELGNSLSRRRYLQQCRRYCPELTLGDLQPYRAGVRAQAVLADGTMVHDFLIRRSARTLHVCNAPSPAATSAIPIAKHLTEQAVSHFVLKSS